MKKLLILGVGAQGSTVAKRMDEEPAVSEIICADYDEKAVNELCGLLDKGTPLQIDATKVENIVKAAAGIDLIVNALPMAFGRIVLEAALQAKTNYQDFAAADTPDIDWVDGIKQMLSETSEKFKAIGKTALISTGSAPGTICIAARDAMRYLDSCETINMYVWRELRQSGFSLSGGLLRLPMPIWLMMPSLLLMGKLSLQNLLNCRYTSSISMMNG